MFVVRKRIDLSFLGEGWQEAFITLNAMSWQDNKKLAGAKKLKDLDPNDKEYDKVIEELLAFLGSKVVEGKGYDGEKLIDITPENFSQLPQDVYMAILNNLREGNPDPKAQPPVKPSGESSTAE